MLTVSGIVPDGVAAAFLTSPDGTAVRADVKDNAYAFVVPRPRTPEQRYVVWTGGDGTPHVQPIGAPFFGPRLRCAKPVRDAPLITPDLASGCGHFDRIVFTAPAPARRLLPAPAPPAAAVPLGLEPCASSPVPTFVAPAVPPLAIPAPKAPRPRRHG